MYTLAARVFAAEREAYPSAINLFADGRVVIDEAAGTIAVRDES
ncbi:MAG: hypothetical protein AB7K09_14215 [Planctomycetota bacterium]